MSHQYSVFNTNKNNQLKEPMFFGQSVNISRFDQQKYKLFEDFIEKQISFFWRPEEIDVSKDRLDFQNLSEHEKHIFVSNLSYQCLLDSVQGRSPNVVLLPLISIPELESWVETWAFMEVIHSRSYTHIIRNIVNDPSVIFDNIIDNEAIKARAMPISQYYDDLYEYSQWYNLLGIGKHTVNGKEIDINKRTLLRKLYLCIISVYVLEAIRFYVSFACSFAFGERKIMEGNAKIIKLISRDEAIHANSTQSIINLLRSGKEGQEWMEVIEECQEETYGIFKSAVEQEKEWAKYLFKDGSMVGLNETIICTYLDYITNLRLINIGMKPLTEVTSNPIPWMNNWTSSEHVQVAPQETEITSYLVGQIDNTISEDDFYEFVL